MENTIKNQKSLEDSCEQLINQTPKFKKVLDLHGFPSIRKQSSGFKALLKTIISQQLSVAAASNIWERIESQGLANLKGIISADESVLRALGLSRQKVQYVKSLAFSGIKFHTFEGSGDEEIISVLTSVKGIGLWSAEIYLMFSMMRSDIFPAGDLALQISASHLFENNEKLSEKELREKSLSWSPNRSAAALMLWDYYASVKNRKGIF